MLKIGIVGLPNVGKSTLFNALTKASVPAENYPFCTIDSSIGMVGVPDARLQKLAELSKSAKTIPAAIEFVDIAGLVKGAAEGEGLGNQFLANIRETDAILQVVRFFDDPNILHVEETVEPKKDIEIINLELVLADTEQVKKRREKLVRDIKAGVKEAIAEDAVLAKLEQSFATGKLALHSELTDDEKKSVKPLNLLTMKPILYALNKKNGGKNLDELSDGRAERAFEFIKVLGSQHVLVDAAIENELNDVADEEREKFRQELGTHEDGLAGLIRGAYDILGLISFFTTGADETRAWTIPRGSAAPAAGAAIHNDFAEKFIRAEVVSTDDLLAAGSWTAAREAAKVRTEGKDYIVKDGDVMVFLHG
ncbi:MAG: redox-regulated ATPase YchF [Candidatus Kaiserbacteria bacterium]|nr:redox-regulated ATPase YchF [Candidatus Kaiserbacteria bacterium]